MIATNKSYVSEIEALLEGDADVNYPHEVKVTRWGGGEVGQCYNFSIFMLYMYNIMCLSQKAAPEIVSDICK